MRLYQLEKVAKRKTESQIRTHGRHRMDVSHTGTDGGSYHWAKERYITVPLLLPIIAVFWTAISICWAKGWRLRDFSWPYLGTTTRMLRAGHYMYWWGNCKVGNPKAHVKALARSRLTCKARSLKRQKSAKRFHWSTVSNTGARPFNLSQSLSDSGATTMLIPYLNNRNEHHS